MLPQQSVPDPTPQVVNLFPDQPPSMFAIEFVRRELVPVGRDKWYQIIKDEIPHVTVGNRFVVSTHAVSMWLMGKQEAPVDDGGSVLRMVVPESVDRAVTL